MEKDNEGLFEKVNKLSLPATILIASIILGGFYYFSQLSKQNSIEKQQQVELELKKEAEEQDYINDRRDACLQIYKTESDKWNNTTGYEYVSDDDICYISYKSKQGEWKDVNCEDIGKDFDYEFWGWDSPFTRSMLRRSSNCSNGEFEKEF